MGPSVNSWSRFPVNRNSRAAGARGSAQIRDKRPHVLHPQRQLPPQGGLNHLCGAFPPGILWPVILLPCVHMHLLANMDSSENGYGWEDIT